MFGRAPIAGAIMAIAALPALAADFIVEGNVKVGDPSAASGDLTVSGIAVIGTPKEKPPDPVLTVNGQTLITGPLSASSMSANSVVARNLVRASTATIGSSEAAGSLTVYGLAKFGELSIDNSL